MSEQLSLPQMFWQIILNDELALDNALRSRVSRAITMTSLVPGPALLLIDQLSHCFNVFIFIRWDLLDTICVPFHVFSAGKVVGRCHLALRSSTFAQTTRPSTSGRIY